MLYKYQFYKLINCKQDLNNTHDHIYLSLKCSNSNSLNAVHSKRRRTQNKFFSLTL